MTQQHEKCLRMAHLDKTASTPGKRQLAAYCLFLPSLQAWQHKSRSFTQRELGRVFKACQFITNSGKTSISISQRLSRQMHAATFARRSYANEPMTLISKGDSRCAARGWWRACGRMQQRVASDPGVLSEVIGAGTPDVNRMRRTFVRHGQSLTCLRGASLVNVGL